MTVDQGTAGRFAIASGIVTIVAAIVLMIFFAVEAPALVDSGNVDRITVFGSTNDALIALALSGQVATQVVEVVAVVEDVGSGFGHRL